VSRIFAIDPGPEQSAYVTLFNGEPEERALFPNHELASIVKLAHYDNLVIEMVESFGMAVGKEVFNTCVWIGRFDHMLLATLMPRRTVKMHLCHSMKAKDANIRQALIDRFGPGKEKAIGKKATPGPLYGFKSHLWSALALAVTFHDLQKGDTNGIPK
jgi:hypothetical protein